MTKLKDAHKAQDVTAIDSAMAEVNAALQAAQQDFANAQAAGGAQPGAEQGGQTPPSDDTVTDVPFEEVK